MAVMAMTATTTRMTILRPTAMTMTMQAMMMMVMTMTTNAILKMQEKMTTTRKMHVFLGAVFTSMCAELLLRGRTKSLWLHRHHCNGGGQAFAKSGTPRAQDKPLPNGGCGNGAGHVRAKVAAAFAAPTPLHRRRRGMCRLGHSAGAGQAFAVRRPAPRRGTRSDGAGQSVATAN